ncbi:MAG: SRPBCC family protein [Actinomycetota bacterium]
MIRREVETFVNRPVQDVFAYLSDFDNIPRHDPWVEEVERTSSGPIQVGATWRHVRRMGRRRIEAPIELVEYEPNRRLTIVSVSGPISVKAAQTFESSGTGTQVREVVEMSITGALKIMQPLIGRSVRKQAEETHRRFKENLEQRPPSAG